MDDLFVKICKNGRYYYPSFKHYTHLGHVTVQCDRCNRENIHSCIGFEGYDLCLRCADDITDILNRKMFSAPISLMFPKG